MRSRKDRPMIILECNKTSEDMTPVLRDIDIARYAQSVLYDYRPEFFSYNCGDDPYFESALLDPYDFAEKYLDAAVDVQAIYTDSSDDFIAGAAVFNLQKVKVFDKDNMCTQEIIVPANTILLDTRTVHGGSKSFEYFTLMHEAGHLLMHQRVFRIPPAVGFYTRGEETQSADSATLCKRSNIGRRFGGLRTNEDFREHQANTFAACMLMPPRLFIPYVQAMMKSPWTRFDDEIMITRTVNDGTSAYWKYREIVRKVARRFGVSDKAAEVQLSKYGLQADLADDNVYEARRRLKMYRSLWA